MKHGIALEDRKAIGTQRNTDSTAGEDKPLFERERKCRRANRLFVCRVGSKDSKFGTC